MITVDFLLSPYLRFLGPRYRRIVVEVVNVGPLDAHSLVLETIDEELDEVRTSAARLGGVVLALRERVIRCHRENAGLFKLVCERASEVWPEHRVDCLDIANVLSEPPECVRAAFAGVEVRDIGAFEQFRFLHGYKDVDGLLWLPDLVDGNLIERLERIEDFLARTPRSLAPHVMPVVRSAWTRRDVRVRHEDLSNLTYPLWVRLAGDDLASLPADPAAAAVLTRVRGAALTGADVELVRAATKKVAQKWWFVFRTSEGDRPISFNRLFGADADYLNSLAKYYCRLPYQEREALLSHLGSSELSAVASVLSARCSSRNQSKVRELASILVKLCLLKNIVACAKVIRAIDDQELVSELLQRIVDERPWSLREDVAQRLMGSIKHSQARGYLAHCESIRPRRWHYWLTDRDWRVWYLNLATPVFIEANAGRGALSVEQYGYLLSYVTSGELSGAKFTVKRLLALKTDEGKHAWRAVLDDPLRSGKLAPRGDVSAYRGLLHLLKSAPTKTRLEVVAAYPSLAKKLGVAEETQEFAPSKSTLIAAEVSQALGGWSSKYIQHLMIEAWRARMAGQIEVGFALDDHYRTYDLPKKAGGKRQITVPSKALKSLQRAVLHYLLEDVELCPQVHGFRKGHSILTNASPHVGKDLVVNVDIDSFFPSVKFARVHRALRRTLRDRLSGDAIRFLAEVCCFNGGLPTGAPTSPAVANLVLTPLDKSLAVTCERYGIEYTRYADDLTFSGSGDAKRIIPFVRKCLASISLEVDADKLNLFRRGRRQEVTGLVVNSRVNLPRRIRRRLRAAVHVASQGGEPLWHGRPMKPGEMNGHLAYLGMVSPEEARRLRQRLAPERD